MEIVRGEIKTNELSKNAMGGSELVATKLAELLDPNLLKEFQIINTRVRELDESLLRILWIHDLPGDPECDHLKSGGWKRFHKIVFVSNWQMQQFIGYYRIPWHMCAVMPNAIVPIEKSTDKKDNLIRIVYHTTPHRGLDILVDVFEELQNEQQDIQLDVFSSFNLYGWPNRDEQYKDLFARITGPQMNYHGFQPNPVVRKALAGSDIFGYPSTWMETSCICLIEAMSAGLMCVHPNLGALFETSSNWTTMYQWAEDKRIHKEIFKANLQKAIDMKRNGQVPTVLLNSQQAFTDTFFSWTTRVGQWENMLTSLLNSDRSIPDVSPAGMFTYTV